MQVTLGAGGTTFIAVNHTAGAFTGLHTVGFIVEDADDALALNVVSAITITTLLAGAQAEASDPTQEELDALAVVNGTAGQRIVTFDTTDDFDTIRIDFGGNTATSTLDVTAACVAPR
jgi:hypothetical protein